MVEGKINGFKVEGICPEDFINIIADAEIDVDTDTLSVNGWQCDFWLEGKHGDKKYYITGCAYYGSISMSEKNMF